MKFSFVTIASLIAGATLFLCTAPAAADSQVSWSVTFGSSGHHHAHPPVVVHHPPAVVVHTRPRYIYSTPVQAPPTVIYVPVQSGHQQHWTHHSKAHRHHDRGHWKKHHDHDRNDRWSTVRHDERRWHREHRR